jgi:hypothetical protein
MARTSLICFVVVCLVGGGFGTIPASPARAQSSEERAVQITAEAIFGLAAERKFNAMYDRIHPDAHQIVPRAAAVGTFSELYSILQAGESEIVDIDFEDWTWGVTGQEYEHAAAVEFTQPYVENGKKKLLEDTMYLVSVQGDWRWFFGSSREFVDAAIEKYGGYGTPLTEGNLLENVVTDLDDFYKDAFSYTDLNYESPGVVLVEEGDSVRTACGPASTGFWAFYCPGDKTVYLDDVLLSSLEDQDAGFDAAFVIAHEWAHHVQTTVGIDRVDPGEMPQGVDEVFSIELELMADCMSGAWALDVDSRGLLEPDDIDQTVQFAVDYLGDPAGIGETDPQAHGSADQRVQSILTGYEDGFVGCNIFV